MRGAFYLIAVMMLTSIVGFCAFMENGYASEYRASLGAGLAEPEVADPVGYMTRLSFLAPVDDSFGGYMSILHLGFPAKSPGIPVSYDTATAGLVGFEYRLNVAHSVPYLRAAGGIVCAAGTPSVSAPVVEMGIGVRWRAERFDFALELGRYQPMDEFGGIGGGMMGQFQVGYWFEPGVIF